MKKIITLISAILLSLGGVHASAAVGDVNGTALNTDIVAYINHYAIPSYAVNGQSVIVAEDLSNFGFNVVWNAADKSLNITRNAHTSVRQMNVDKSAIPSTVFANTLETDIRVFANGKQITSYAINGYTMVPIEELTCFGLVNWVAEEKAIKLWVDGLHSLPEKQPVTISLHTLYNMNLEERQVLPSEVEAYRAVGWYYYNDFVCEWANKLCREQGYAEGAKYLKDKLFSAEFKYGSTATLKQWDTLNSIYKKWYSQLRVPLVILGSHISYNSIGTPRANIQLWNISGKHIESFELEFVCYDAYGKITTDYSFYNGSFIGWIDDANFDHGKDYNFYWDLYSNSRTKSVRNIRLTKVAFSDGTVWYR